MELRYLSRLIEGQKVPFDPKFRSLSAERKQKVEDFVRDLATRYSSEENRSSECVNQYNARHCSNT